MNYLEIGDPLQSEYEQQFYVNLLWWVENLHLEWHLDYLNSNFKCISEFWAGLHFTPLHHAWLLYEHDSLQQDVLYANPWVNIKTVKENSGPNKVPLLLDLSNCNIF